MGLPPESPSVPPSLRTVPSIHERIGWHWRPHRIHQTFIVVVVRGRRRLHRPRSFRFENTRPRHPRRDPPVQRALADTLRSGVAAALSIDYAIQTISSFLLPRRFYTFTWCAHFS